MFRALVLFGVMSSLIAAGQKTMGGSSAGAASAGQSAGTAGITGSGVSAVGATPGASLSTVQGAGTTAQPGATNLGTTGTTFTTPVGTVITTGTTTSTGQDAGTAAMPGSGNTNQVPNTNSQVVGTSNGVLNTTSGFVTTSPIGVATAPLVSPPNIALPGSGPATGAPPSMTVNDPRFGGLGSVVPGGSVPISAFTPAPAGARGDTFHGVLNTGLGTVVDSSGGGGTSNPQGSAANQPSVADVARMYKARQGNTHPREYDNARIYILQNSNARNNATLMPQNTSQAAPSANANQPTTAALDPRDLAIVEGELARSRAASAGQATGQNTEVAQAQAPAQPQSQTQPQTQSGASATEPTTPSAVQRPSTGNTQANANAKTKQQLPATASPLPLLGLFGLAAAGVGAIVRARRREL